MCDVVGLGMGGMSVASSIFGFMGADKQARAEADYKNQLMIQRNKNYLDRVEYQKRLADWQDSNFYKRAKSVAESVNDQYTAVLESIQQAQDRNAQQIARASRQAQQASAFIRASAAETETTGKSIRIAQQQSEKSALDFAYVGFKNLSNLVNQSQRNLRAIASRGQSAVNQAMPAPMAPLDPVAPMQAVQKPSAMPYLLQGGMGVMGAYASYQSNQLAQQGLDLQKLGNPDSGFTKADYLRIWGKA